MTRDKGKFTPGASGNPSGKSKTQWLTNALRMKLAEDPSRARTIAEKVIQMAEEGDLEATKLIWDRLEGKPIQQVEIDATITALPPEERMRRLVELQGRIVKTLVADAEDDPVLDLKALPDGSVSH
jgi:hypothetical protein